MTDRFLFSVTTAATLGNKHLGSMKPDADGYYLHPGAVINHHTENETFYVPEDFRTQIVSGDNIFNRNLTRGSLFGEADHPDVKGTKEDIQRLVHVQRDRVSHHIAKVETIPLDTVQGAYLVMLKVKPTGAFGDQLKEEFESRLINTCFSLRSLIRERYDPRRRLRIRNILQLITFDWVTVGGSPEASKRFSGLNSNIGIETYSTVLSPELLVRSVHKYGNAVGCESMDDSTLKKMLGDLEITVSNSLSEVGIKEPGKPNFIDTVTGDRRSILHTGFRQGGLK